MDWNDQAILLSARPYGESAALALLLTRDHGRHAGLLHGGQSARYRALLEPGNLLTAGWRARVADQLGSWSLEVERAYAAPFLDDPQRLACLASVCALLDGLLADREPHPGLFGATIALFEALSTDVWAEVYVRWEIGLLEEVGFGLDLSRCAASGQAASDLFTGNDRLSHVSPRTGRAVSASAAEPYKSKLLPLPPFLLGLSEGGPEEVQQGLALTGHFLEHRAFAQRHVEVPSARVRFVERYARIHRP
ncbi:DNA repair protein RecO [Niveispirillum lacus]|uniref:DNA repair protein RecO n=1 Tax=Niveispirillum lacus TaxID=1981099 RepID=A0A255YWU7_9PROT|nr:DNA repair protein RecO [Niveispirillum lacus]OYQ33713.1 DNA repair protein RecO [Niveispirillum lacus]